MASSGNFQPVPPDRTRIFAPGLSRALESISEINPMLRVALLTVHMVLNTSGQPDWDDIKSEIASLVSYATIATFLAAVQSQIIALSYQDNTSHVAVASNALGFAGVLFDVSSACFALGASTTLQRHTTIIDNEINAIDDASPRQLAQLNLAGLVDAYGVSDITARIHKKLETRMRILRTENQSQTPLLRATQASWKEVQGALAVGNAASNLMILGVVCFFGSVICLAVSTQPRTVWIVSVVVTAWVIFAVLTASVLLAAKWFWKRMRGLW
ncbi:hypothetical protein R3P38DRAFT_3423892 [Favolaschia claudopus]|uniref:Transmembrane protein n=1 Tax=Favolaschia claudopus TaxID=2862362 RepID=A0AAV9ZYN0_9AGAR